MPGEIPGPAVEGVFDIAPNIADAPVEAFAAAVSRHTAEEALAGARIGEFALDDDPAGQ